MVIPLPDCPSLTRGLPYSNCRNADWRDLDGPNHTFIQPPPPPLSPRLAALTSALAIGIASALGYTVGLVLCLPRDFWIVVAIIVAVRPTSLTLTVTFTSMMIIGTIAGALISAAITLETNNHYLLLALLFCFAVVVFATVGVNISWQILTRM